MYLKTDVCLLADVFENFRSICLKQYLLDPAHYLTSPSLDPLLKKIGPKLELLIDVDMRLFIEIARKTVMPTEEQILAKKKRAKQGYFLEVDLEYPVELHKARNGYPLAPEKRKSRKKGSRITKKYWRESWG